MHIGDLIGLAIIGRRHIVEQSGRNIIGWLGQLPTEEEIKTAGNRIYHHIPDAYGQIDYQEITDPMGLDGSHQSVDRENHNYDQY